MNRKNRTFTEEFKADAVQLVLEKRRGLIREGTAVSGKSTLIHAEKATFTIELMARLLGVSRAGYNAWVKRLGTLSEQAARRMRLAVLITQIHDDSHQTSGFRRVLAELARRGIAVSEGLVRGFLSSATSPTCAPGKGGSI